jgi:hypothetical protein
VSAGIGVYVSTLIRARAFGKCPFRAPASGSLDGAKMAELRAPNIEQATKKGITHDITPRILSPNVYGHALVPDH